MPTPERDAFPDNRAWLRSLSFARVSPPAARLPDPASAPHEAFLRWLEQAVAAGIPEPHVATLATIGADGLPQARVLMLRDLDESGWSFSGPAFSPKGRALAARPVAALTFYWREHGRQVRVTGTVSDAGRDAAIRDFHNRSDLAQVVAEASRQSDPLCDEQEYWAAVRDAQQRIEQEPWLVPDHWRVWRIAATIVEFWQADPGRRHLRRRFERAGDRWTAQDLWP
ncbi:MAG: pyridoxal 5'-phosphate synthase [Aldersonia sp.]|nr:pyridoxal 5'-phosphate synthase [Aldersonia sp.]